MSPVPHKLAAAISLQLQAIHDAAGIADNLGVAYKGPSKRGPDMDPEELKRYKALRRAEIDAVR